MENNNHHHCGCGHNHDHDHGHNHGEEYETILLTLEDDKELECLVLEMFKIEEQEYIALLPKGEENVMLYRYQEEETDGPQLTNIEDEQEFQMASDVFLEIMNLDAEEEEVEELEE